MANFYQEKDNDKVATSGQGWHGAVDKERNWTGSRSVGVYYIIRLFNIRIYSNIHTYCQQEYVYLYILTYIFLIYMYSISNRYVSYNLLYIPAIILKK